MNIVYLSLYNFIFNIASILQLPHISSEDFQPKFGSGVKTTDAHIHLEGMEAFIYYIMKLSGKSRVGSQADMKLASEIRERLASFFCD